MKKAAKIVAIVVGSLFAIQIVLGMALGFVIALQHPECIETPMPMECAFE